MHGELVVRAQLERQRGKVRGFRVVAGDVAAVEPLRDGGDQGVVGLLGHGDARRAAVDDRVAARGAEVELRRVVGAHDGHARHLHGPVLEVAEAPLDDGRVVPRRVVADDAQVVVAEREVRRPVRVVGVVAQVQAKQVGHVRVLLVQQLEQRRLRHHGEPAKRQPRDAVHHERLDVAVLVDDLAERDVVELQGPEVHAVLGLVARDLAAPVVDLELAQVAVLVQQRLVRRRRRVVERRVVAALVAAAAGDPQVAAARVEDDAELLGRRADADLPDVLVVEVVREHEVVVAGRAPPRRPRPPLEVDAERRAGARWSRASRVGRGRAGRRRAARAAEQREEHAQRHGGAERDGRRAAARPRARRRRALHRCAAARRRVEGPHASRLPFAFARRGDLALARALAGAAGASCRARRRLAPTRQQGPCPNAARPRTKKRSPLHACEDEVADRGERVRRDRRVRRGERLPEREGRGLRGRLSSQQAQRDEEAQRHEAQEDELERRALAHRVLVGRRGLGEELPASRPAPRERAALDLEVDDARRALQERLLRRARRRRAAFSPRPVLQGGDGHGCPRCPDRDCPRSSKSLGCLSFSACRTSSRHRRFPLACCAARGDDATV